MFLGYSTTQKGYKLYHPVTRKYLVSKDVIFDETSFYYKSDRHETLRDLGYLKLLDNRSHYSVESEDDHENLSQIKGPKLTLQDDCLISDPSQEGCDASNPLEVDSPEPASSGMAPKSPIKETGIDPYPKYYKRRPKKNPEVSNEGGAT